jgi:hypothetical protein
MKERSLLEWRRMRERSGMLGGFSRYIFEEHSSEFRHKARVTVAGT